MASSDLTPFGGPAQAPPPPPIQDEAEQTALRALGRLVRRRWFVILVPLLAVPAVAVALSNSQQKQYTTAATLIVADSGKNDALASVDPAREVATNISLLQTGVITDRAKARLGGNEGNVTFTGDQEANLITIEATSRSPQRAADLANGASRQFVKFRQQQAQDAITAEQKRISAKLTALRNDTSRTAANQRAVLRGRAHQLAITSATLISPVRQIGIATPPNVPSSPHPARSGIIGALLGLAIGFIIAFALERLDLRVRDPREFETAFGRPILGRIPRSRALAKTPPGISLPPVEAQAFADLRAKLRHATESVYPAMNGNGNGNGHGRAHTRTVVVTSAEAAEGKTTVAWHLACAAATPRSKVLVIEADLRRPGLSAKLGTDGTPGLSEVLQGYASLEEATREIPIESRMNGNGRARLRTVDVLFAGSPASDPTGLLESREMKEVLERVGAEYDLVIVDTPPTSVAQDAVPLVTRSDGVVVVGRLAKSRVGSITELSKTLNELNAHTYGVVVNSTDVPRDIYHYYYDRRSQTPAR